MKVEDQIDDNENAGNDGAEPDDVPAAIEPKVLAVSIEFAGFWSVGEHVELPLAPVKTRHVPISLTSGLAFGPVSHGVLVSGGRAPGDLQAMIIVELQWPERVTGSINIC